MTLPNKPETRPATSRNGDELWLPDTPGHEACSWACSECGAWILSFLAAYRERESARMDAACKGLRHVATRLDCFRRMKLRQWERAAQDAAGTGSTHD
jgi:hypothetical protein